MEVLTAHLREYRKAASRAPGADEGMAEAELHVGELPAEAQEIATVIGRRRVERDGAGHRLDLQGVDLRSVKGSKAHLEGANLARATLSGVDLTEVLSLTWPRLRTTRDFDLARFPPEVRQEAERELNAEAVGD